MLIDAAYPEETRVAVVEDNKLEEFDLESASKIPLKGNVFLAKVARVEPSLQAAFVDFGHERHGFLSLHEIHHDYYQLPVEDREEFEQWVANATHAAPSGEEEAEAPTEGAQKNGISRLREQFLRRYKIQEVIKRRQVLLVQVVREERGNKGAALTTYLSLAGRYVVLMPNSDRSGGVSRKITNDQDRKRLKDVIGSLQVPSGMGVVARTAGVERSKTDIKRDYEYLLKTWEQIRSVTLQSTAPVLVHEEANIVKRAIRDMYTRDITEILVEGEEGYKTAKDFIKSLIPSHARRVQLFKEKDKRLFQAYNLEEQIDSIYETRVNLGSGGYLFINATEALVAIDVNSGRSTRERNIEETALRTNLEAATEIARQLRVRDLAGLIVIDFIDMSDHRNNAAVERRMKEATKGDRARIQIGKISPFGMMELSRQRLGRSIFEASTFPCPCCEGAGIVRSTESTAICVLRAIEEKISKREKARIKILVAPTVASYLLNHKRNTLCTLESSGSVQIAIESSAVLTPGKFELKVEQIVSDEEKEVVGGSSSSPKPTEGESKAESSHAPDEENLPAKKRGSRRRRRRSSAPQSAPGEEITSLPHQEEEIAEGSGLSPKLAEGEGGSAPDEEGLSTKKRGSRRRRRKSSTPQNAPGEEVVSFPRQEESFSEETPLRIIKPRILRPGRARVKPAPEEKVTTLSPPASEAPAESTSDQKAQPAKGRRSPKKEKTPSTPASRTKKKVVAASGEEPPSEMQEAAASGKARRGGWWRRFAQ
jgi:ribonuclease E